MPTPLELPVIFRKHKEYGQWDVTAFFPTLFASSDNYWDMTCYAHIGQHSAASPEYVTKGELCSPAEYADLLAELKQIYEGDPEDPIVLKVYKRQQASFIREREKEFRKWRSKA